MKQEVLSEGMDSVCVCGEGGRSLLRGITSTPRNCTVPSSGHGWDMLST